MTRDQAISIAHDNKERDADVLYSAAATLLGSLTATPDDLYLANGLVERAKQRAAPSYEDEGPRCTGPRGHEWAYSGTQYGGDDSSYHGEGRCYCIYCGTDGDA